MASDPTRFSGWAAGIVVAAAMACNGGDSSLPKPVVPPGIYECYRYVENAQACMAIAALDPVGLDRDEICSEDTYTAFNQKAYACMADVYQYADCNSLAGLAQAGDEAQSCSPYGSAPPAAYCCPARQVGGRDDGPQAGY